MFYGEGMSSKYFVIGKIYIFLKLIEGHNTSERAKISISQKMPNKAELSIS